MAIYRYCPQCRTGFSLEKKACPRCGAKGQALKYRVLVRSKTVGAKSAIVPTLTAAREMETHFQEEITRAKILGEKIQKKKEILVQDAWKKYYLPKISDLSPDEKRFRENYGRNYILPAIGAKKLEDVDSADIEKIKATALEDGKSPRTVQHLLFTIRNSLKYMKDLGFLDRNPADVVRSPRVSNQRLRFLSREEASKLLAECRKRNTIRNRIYPLVMLALATGARRGELFSLRWGDIDFREGIARLHQTKNREKRILYLSRECLKALKELKKQLQPRDTDLIFEENGKPRTKEPSTLRRIFDRLFNSPDTPQKIGFPFTPLGTLSAPG